MKKSTSLLLLSLGVLAGIGALRAFSFSSIGCVASPCVDGKAYSFSGCADLANKTLASLNGSGSATLDTVTVHGAVNHSGTFRAQGGSFGSLNISGSVKLDGVTILGDTRISGSLSAIGSTLNALKFSSNKSVLTRCTVASIVMKAPSNDKEPLVIELDGTTVLGDISFEGAQGQVIMLNGAVVKGQVNDGTVLRK